MTAAAYASTKPARRRGLSYDDLLKFPDDGKRRAIGGVLFVTPSPSTRQQRIVGNLYFFLRRHLEAQGGGEAFLSPFDVVLYRADETAKFGSALELRREDDDRLESFLFPGLRLPLSAVCAS